MSKKEKDQPEKVTKEKDTGKNQVAKTEAIQPLRVEIHFPSVFDLKQALAFDADGNLLIGVQFKAKVDQYEIFRLVNLLKQPHGLIYATIGSAQSAMDFKFTKDGKVEIVKAQIAAEKSKKAESDKPQEIITHDDVAKILQVSFNHIPEDPNPFGVFIEYVNGNAEIKDVAGRGDSATEAVIAGVQNCGIVGAAVKEPFEIKAALEALEPSAENYKLIRVIDVGSFPINESDKKE